MGFGARLFGAFGAAVVLAGSCSLSYYHARGRQAEARYHLGGIRTQLEAFFAENDFYPMIEVEPAIVASLPASERRPWTKIACDPACGPRDPISCRAFDCIGWAPQGDVRYWYACTTSVRDGVWNYTCAAVGDLDDDGRASVFVLGSGRGGGGTIVAPIPNIAAGAGCAVGVTPADEVVWCSEGVF